MIERIYAREVLDSRGFPTVECEILAGPYFARASVPSGASTGRREALELRDGEKRFLGKGVKKACSNINNIIAKKITGMRINQENIDNKLIEMAGENKQKLGANATLAVSMAVCKLATLDSGLRIYEHLSNSLKRKSKMPIPLFNIINGGRHGFGIDFQEYHIIPTKKTFAENLQSSCDVYHTLKAILIKRFGSASVGDEAGFTPPLTNVKEPLELIMNAVEECGYAKEFNLGLDVAASTFYKNGYTVEGKKMGGSELIDLYTNLTKTYPLLYLEDPFHEEDWIAWTELTKKIGDRVKIVGDDLLCTNPQLIRDAIKKKACNSLLLKINQIGTISEALNAAKIAIDAKFSVIVSNRSGESEDSFIADLAVAVGDYCKFGAPAHERTIKYNQLLRIEEKLK
ncbi:MAG: phosphopyruvate hydratase [Candidatus Aenigmatarchaeota archaeon]